MHQRHRCTTLGPRGTELTPTPFAVESGNAWSLGDAYYTSYARTDIDEYFYGNVTMYEPMIISDTNNVVADLYSSSTIGCRIQMESGSSARTWTIGTTGSGTTEGGDRFSIWDASSGVPGLVIEGASGNVGVGTSNPDGLLDVIDGRFRVATTATGSGNVFADVTAEEHGLLGVINESSNAANNCTMLAKISFMVDNPDDETTDLYYACVEGPEAAMYVRGTAQLVNGEAVVTLPRHFTAMALAEGITVQIAPPSPPIATASRW